MRRIESKRKAVGELVVVAVEVCQADLCACFDLLAEADDPQAADVLEDELFAAHRALNLLRVAARRVAGPEVCSLLRRPGKA